MGLEDYKINKIVGKGSFGKVYLCRNLRENRHYCMKCIKLTNIPAAERAACRHEVKLMQRLNHPNIVGYKDSFFAKRGSQLCIVMTYCDGGDLSDRVKRQLGTGRKFKEDQVLHYFVQIALGLHFMHEQNVLHRDLKTQNIFLLGNGRLVLGDLGISKVLEGKQDFAQTCIGTPYYMSPELFKNKPYNHKSDVWALGCILYELCTLKHAFDAKSLNGLASKIMRGTYPTIHRSYSSSTRRLVKEMLSKSPHQRPDLSKTLQMPFIKKRVANFMSDVVMSKPASKIGAGTMVVRGAFMQLGGIQGAAGGLVGGAQDAKDMLSLQSQLEKLGMKQMIADALNRDENSDSHGDHSSGNNKEARPGMPPRHGKGSKSRNNERNSNDRKGTERNNGVHRAPLEPRGGVADVRAQEARRRQRERQRDARDALRREKERKAAVEHALEKLRKERENRFRQKKEMAANKANLANRQNKLKIERRKREVLRIKKAKRLKAEQDRASRDEAAGQGGISNGGNRKSTREELLAKKEREARAIDSRSKRRHEAAAQRKKKIEREQASRHEREAKRKKMVRQRSKGSAVIKAGGNVQQEIDEHRKLRRVASAASANEKDKKDQKDKRDNKNVNVDHPNKRDNKYRHANPQRIRQSNVASVPSDRNQDRNQQRSHSSNSNGEAQRERHRPTAPDSNDTFADGPRRVRDLDEWDRRNQKKILEKQKEKGDKVEKRKPPQQQQQQQQKQQQQDVPLVPQTPPKFAKNKWKEENDRMGDILEQYKKRREKKEEEAKKRQHEVLRAHAVAKQGGSVKATASPTKQSNSNNNKPMDRRQVKIEKERESRRIKEQRDIVTGKPPRFHNPSNPSKNRKSQRSNKGDGSKIQSQMKADLNQMNQDIQRMKEKVQEKEKRTSVGSNGSNNGISNGPKVRNNVFPTRKSRTPSPPPPPSSPAPSSSKLHCPPNDIADQRLKKKEAWSNSNKGQDDNEDDNNDNDEEEDDNKYGHLSARDQVLARKRDRQQQKDEETRRQHLAAAEQIAIDTKKAQNKARAQYQPSKTPPKQKTTPSNGRDMTPLPSIRQEDDDSSPVIQGVMLESLERGPSINDWLPHDRYEDDQDEFSHDHFASKYEEPMPSNIESKIQQPFFEDETEDGIDVDLLDLEQDEGSSGFGMEEEDDFEPSSFVVDEEDELAEEEALQAKEEELQLELTQAETRMATLRATMNQGRVRLGRKIVEDPEEDDDDDEDTEEGEDFEEDPNANNVHDLHDHQEQHQERRGGGIRGGIRSDFRQPSRVEEVEDEFEDYPQDEDEELYEFDFDPDDHVPNSTHSVLPASSKRANLRTKLERDLGKIEFAAAYKILGDRYHRLETDSELPNDDSKVVEARMRKLLGNQVEMYKEIERLVYMEYNL